MQEKNLSHRLISRNLSAERFTLYSFFVRHSLSSLYYIIVMRCLSRFLGSLSEYEQDRPYVAIEKDRKKGTLDSTTMRKRADVDYADGEIFDFFTI